MAEDKDLNAFKETHEEVKIDAEKKVRIGFIGCGLNYPIYKKKLEKGKAKYAYEIVELARQISEQ